jgi:hypothetical protein
MITFFTYREEKRRQDESIFAGYVILHLFREYYIYSIPFFITDFYRFIRL